jgi:hypothetical protein
MAFSASDIKYFENGVLILNLTGGTTHGKGILGLTSIDFKYSVDTIEVSAFDLNRNVLKIPNKKTWSISCEGLFLTLSGDTYLPSSGDTKVTGGISSKELMQAVKLAATTNQIILKVGPNHYEKGNVLLSDFSFKASSNEAITFSLQLDGSGDLAYSAT